MKKDIRRFPRAKLRKAGGILETADVVSVFDTEASQADARAFRQLMAHLKEIDEKTSTVIMVQVENESGLLGDSRDASAGAERHFHVSVPRDLVKKLSSGYDSLRPELKHNLRHFDPQNSEGSWPEVFGPSKQTDELFMAYHYALYIERVARAGKEAYSLPLYINAWQNFEGSGSANDDDNFPVVVGGGDKPGDYPSGGAVLSVVDIYQLFAPSIALVSPDIYFNDYAATCAAYRHRHQPLLIPEQRRDEHGARRAWVAFGSHQAIGTSPFAVDTLEPGENAYKRHYGLLASVAKFVLKAQREGSSIGFFFDEMGADGKDPSPLVNAQFGEWRLRIERSFVFGRAGPGAGMVIHRGGDTFLLIGWGFGVTFRHERKGWTGILRFEEKEVVDGGAGLRTLRMLNGDETRSGACALMPNEAPDLGDFPICVTIPARTAVAECEVYALEEE